MVEQCRDRSVLPRCSRADGWTDGMKLWRPELSLYVLPLVADRRQGQELPCALAVSRLVLAVAKCGSGR